MASNTGSPGQDQAWYTCASGAFTAIDFGPWSQQDAVVEFSGVNTSLCLDKNPALLAQNTTTWSTNPSGTTSQAHELGRRLDFAVHGNPRLCLRRRLHASILANGTSSALIVCYAVETSIGTYTVTGTATTAVASQEAGVYTFEYP